MKIYLDNCCYNRPYDNQSYLSISVETQAKLYVQELIKAGQLDMVNSYMLEFENQQNPYEMRRQNISRFLKQYEAVYVSVAKEDEVIAKAKQIMQTGVKYKDACHVACALIAGCDYLLTTDRRLLKYQTDEIKILNPVEFVNIMEEY